MDDKLLRDITILHELMQGGGWKSLSVRGETVAVVLSDDRAQGLPTVAPVEAPAPAAAAPAARLASSGAAPRQASAAAQIDPGWIMIAAPNLGTFYRSPKPGSPAFVELGQTVTAGAELCLIEVMKLFTSVRAPGAGIVRHIAVEDGQLVDGGQPLIYIERE